MDQEYISARSLRKRLQNLPDKTRYNAQNCVCARLADAKRTAYYSNLVTSSSNQKDTYKVLRKLTGNEHDSSNPSSTDPQHTANAMNMYFARKVANIRQSLPDPSAVTPILEAGRGTALFNI